MGRRPHVMMQYERDQKTGLPYTPRSSRPKSRRINPAAGRLHVVDEARQLKIGRQLQDVHVVGLAVELDELAAPIRAALCDDFSSAIEHRPGDALAPILCDENQVVMPAFRTLNVQ